MQFKLLCCLALLGLGLTACGSPPTAEPAPAAAPAEVAAPTVAAVEPTVAEAPTAAMSATSGVNLPGVDPISTKGDISTAGSSTVFPLSERMAARFKDEGYTGNVTVDSIGTGAGFERFCKKGETDISNASRSIKPEEETACKAIGREPIAFHIGTDAMAIAVSKANTFLDNVTIKELGMIYSPTYTLWADINPAWPKEKIQRFSPGTDSGTFDYFVEVVFNKDKKPILASNPQLSEDDNVLVTGVEGSPYAIGYFGYAYFEQNASRLKALSVEGVAPSKDSAHDGSYKLARPLYLYSTAKIMKEKPQVASFINFYLTHVNEEIDKVGYFSALPNDLDKSKQDWMAAVAP